MTTKETSWQPRITTGLSGARYPEEDLEPHADDGQSIREPGVYILKCSQPSDWATVGRAWDKHYEKEMPDYIRTAFEADGVLYVGAAKDVLERLHEHLRDPESDKPRKTSALLKVYPVHSVWGVEWKDSPGEAFERESQIALQLQNDLTGFYVHQR